MILPSDLIQTDTPLSCGDALKLVVKKPLGELNVRSKSVICILYTIYTI